jgi:uncharacterized membrane protein
MRTRPARLALIVLGAVLVVGVIPAFAAGGAIWGIAITALAYLVWWLLRLSIRTVADLPDRFLDERQIAVRNRAYLDAFRIYASVIGGMATLGLIAFVLVAEDDQATLTITWSQAFGVVMFALVLPMILPSMVVAYREPGEVPQQVAA